MADRVGAALAVVDRRADQVLPLLRRWVEINSFTANVEGVNAVGDRLAEAFAPLALRHERHPGKGVGDHLVWFTDAWKTGARGILLVGHHDTVFPPGAFDVWEEGNGRARGPGILDMKGGLSVIWAALSALSESGGLAEIPLAAISVGDEEIGSGDSRPLLESLAKQASGALVFEAGRLGDEVITRRKGIGSLVIDVAGRAAHAGADHGAGVSAIRALARIIDAIESLTNYSSGVTVNVGLVSGGEARNTVPPRARADVDLRFLTATDASALIGTVRSLAQRVAVETRAKVTIEGGVRRQPLERTASSAALYERYAACARAVGLGGDEAGIIGGVSDANTASSVGTPAIDGLGPRGAGFHTYDEYIEVSTLAQRTAALVRFLLSPG